MKDKISTFLLQNPDLFIWHMSGSYPVPVELIDKYKDHWDWSLLTDNEKLPWSTSLFFQFEDYWSWGDPEDPYSPNIQDSPYFPLSLEILRKHKEKISWDAISQKTGFILKNLKLLDEFKSLLHWDYISGNEELIWSEGLIRKYADKWHWPYLSGNNAIDWTPVLIQKYIDKVDIDRIISGNDEPWLNVSRSLINPNSKPLLQIPGTGKYTKDEFELILKEENWYRMSWDTRIPYTEGLIKYYRDNWDWEELSRNQSLPWTYELIENFKDYWDFTLLSSNEALPWSEDLINAFADLWEWGRVYLKNYLWIIVPGLSGNAGLPWSVELIKKYMGKWFWKNLSHNEGIPWNLGILHTFKEFWVEKSLSWNSSLWRNVFYPHINDKAIDDLMAQIIKKKQA